MFELISAYIILFFTLLMLVALFSPKNSRAIPNREQTLFILNSEVNGMIIYRPCTEDEINHFKFLIDTGLIYVIGDSTFITRNGADLKNNV